MFRAIAEPGNIAIQDSLHPLSQEEHPWDIQQCSHPALTLYSEITSKKVYYSAFYSQVATLLKIIRAFTQHWLHFTSNTPLRKAETLRTEKSEQNQTFVNMYLGIWRYYYCAICILNCLQRLSEKIIKVMMQFTIAKILLKTHFRVHSKLLEKQTLRINCVYQIPSSDRHLSTLSTENSTWLQNLHCSSYHSVFHESQISSTIQKH